MTITRTPLFFGREERSRFGWFHAPAEGMQSDIAVVICQPFGHEFINGHRTVRHLADALAEAGIATLRFDYDGTGDSAGGDEDPARVVAWMESIRDAVQSVRDLSGSPRIGLAGIRLGATLAAAVASELDIAALALWAPVVRGRGYVREMKALYLTNGRENGRHATRIEPGGFVMTEETQNDIGHLELATTNPTMRRAEFGADPDMFLPPHNAVVPENRIAEIVRFFSADAAPGPPPRSIAVRREQQLADGIRESIVQLDSGVFGILSEPANRRSGPTILLPNAGATHHVGPNRLYVFIARTLSRAGFRCLRFDLPGLGDSVSAAENNPYPPTASAAIASVTRELDGESFVPMGLCSGAHAAFHAALEVDGAPIVESVVINPLTFYYKPGMSLDQPPVSYYLDQWQWYMRSIRSRDRWLKLLRGEVQLGRVLRTASQRLRLLLPQKRDELHRDVDRIAASGRKLTFVFSRFDPGYDLLMMSAGRAVKRLRRQGTIALWRIDDADHTFEAQHSRDVMIDSLVTHLRARYLSA